MLASWRRDTEFESQIISVPNMLSKRLLLVLALSISATSVLPAQGTFARTETLVGAPLFNSPDFGSPPATTADQLSDDGMSFDAFAFNAFPFRVGATGRYAFDVDAIGFWDPVLFLYQGTFDPATPLQGILVGATPFFATDFTYIGPPNPGLPFFSMLTAGADYSLVTSTLFAGDGGEFRNRILCPTIACQIIPTVVPEPATTSMLVTGLLLLGLLGARTQRRRRNLAAPAFYERDA